MIDFTPFPRLARLSREMIVTEKIDGTNAQILIIPRAEVPPDELDHPTTPFMSVSVATGDYIMLAGSRTRWLTGGADNFSFAHWVSEHREELIGLGTGRHFGEWWGSGIQRGYNLPKDEKRFSLFNVSRWIDAHQDLPPPQEKQEYAPACCHVVPVLCRDVFDTTIALRTLDALEAHGSHACDGFMKPEGIVVWHIAGNFGLKKTIEKDSQPKSL